MNEKMENPVQNQVSEPSTKNKCKTVLLPDEPVDKDSFGTHEQIAKAIADVIINEDGGKSIALIGTWGSGKSTILKILDANLPEEVKLFVFDAWAHCEDALRLSFLEDLSQFIEIKKGKSKKDEIDPNEKEKKKPKKRKNKSLNNWEKIRESINSTQTKQIINPLGFALIILSYMVMLIGKSISFFPIIEWTLVSLSMLFLLYFLWLFLSHPLNINNISQSLIQSTTIHSERPSSIQFRKVFEDQVSKILGSDKKSKLVIVIDNLDRIECAHARSIWATMRTFFEYGNQEKQSSFNQLWLIVPFSPEMPEKLWPYSSKENQPNEGAIKKIEDSHLAGAFVNKTFQIAFHVPYPVPSDWERYFKDKLRIAFPMHKEKEFHAIYSLYSSIELGEKRLPTPRELILFINKVGAYHRIWGDEIPLSVQAYFVLRAKYISDNISAIYHGIQADRNLEFYLVEGYKEKLACLYTGLPAKSAYQIILSIPIQDYIRTRQYDKFHELSSRYNFYDILYMTIDNMFKGSIDGNFIISAALCIDKLESNEEKDNLIKNTWYIISISAMNNTDITNWSYDQKTSEGLIAIIKHCQDNLEKELVKRATSIISTIRYQKSDEVRFTDVDGWTKRAYYFLDEAEKLGYHDILEKRFSFLERPQAIFMSYGMLRKLNVRKELMNYFYPKDEIKVPIIEFINSNYRSDKIIDSDFYVDAIEFMVKLRNDWDWKNLIDFIAPHIMTDESVPWKLRLYYETLFALKYMSKNKDAENALNNIKLSGYNESHLFKNKEDIRTASIIFFNNFENDEPTSKIEQLHADTKEGIAYYHNVRNNPEQYDDLIIEFTELLIKYDRIRYLIDSYEKNYNRNLVRYVLNKIVDDDRIQSIYIPQIIEEYKGKLRLILGEDRFAKILDKTWMQTVSLVHKEPSSKS